MTQLTDSQKNGNKVALLVDISRNIVIDYDILPDIFLKNLHQINTKKTLFPILKHLVKQLTAVLNATKRISDEIVATSPSVAVDLNVTCSCRQDGYFAIFENIWQPHPFYVS